MTAEISLPNGALANGFDSAMTEQVLIRKAEALVEDRVPAAFHLMPEHSADGVLLQLTKLVCQRHSIDFNQLKPIQRKFLTHYRCSECGLIPLHYINVLHIKRVRCGRCGHLMAFKRKGKYGKMRKDIALELLRVQRGLG